MTLRTPLELSKMSTGDPSLTLIFFKMSTPNPNKTNKSATYYNSKMHLNIEKYLSFKQIQEKNDNFSAEWPLKHP